MPRVPISFAITELQPGGAERTLVEIVCRLDRRRFSPRVISLGPRPALPEDGLVRQLEGAGVPVWFLGGRRFRHGPRVLRRLTRGLRAWHPQILQTFLWHANTLGAIAGRPAGVPHVVTGIRVAEPNRRRNWITRRLASLVERHVCVSESVSAYAADTIGLPRDRLVVLANGVDLARFASAPDHPPPGLPSSRRLLTFVGRLEPQKRVDWLLHLAPEIMRRLPQHDLLIVGHGSSLADLRRTADHPALRDRVHFVGWRSDVDAILSASDLLILPSAYEGMPNVLLEAMAAGKPVVATSVEGAAELLGAAAQAQIVARNDGAGLIERIVQLAGDSTLADALGRQNRQRVDAKFSLDEMVGAYAEFYESLVG